MVPLPATLIETPPLVPRPFLTATALALLPFAAGAQPSFDCAKATTGVEKAICASPALSALDREMADAYAAALREWGEARHGMISDQRHWLRNLQKSCAAMQNNPQGENCLVGQLRARINFIRDNAKSGAFAASDKDKELCRLMSEDVGQVPVSSNPYGFLSQEVAILKTSWQVRGDVSHAPENWEVLVNAAGIDLDKVGNGADSISLLTGPGQFGVGALQSIDGTMSCQTLAFFEYRKDGSIRAIRPPYTWEDQPCWTDRIFVGTVHGTPVVLRDVIMSAAPRMQVFTRHQNRWHAACEIKTKYKAAFHLRSESCLAHCDELRRATPIWALGFDGLGGSGPKMPAGLKPIPFDDLSTETRFLPEPNGPIDETYMEIGGDTAFEVTVGNDALVIRIGRGEFGWRTVDDILIGVYRRTIGADEKSMKLEPIAGFYMEKRRVALESVETTLLPPTR